MSNAPLQDFLARHQRLLVITGAGCSAPSGIATYRDAAGDWQRSQPIQHQDFVSSETARQRYWARSMRGWPMFATARANAAHQTLARLEQTDRIACVVTQNVDGLHQQAGQRRLIELHGSLSRVVCLSCGDLQPRDDIQDWLDDCNPQLREAPGRPAPDGDADLGGAESDPSVRIPDCDSCGGILKPDVVFYGDSVPRTRVDAAFAALDQADALLVVGSSLMVFSSYRFCRRAWQQGIPMAAINIGKTRADAWFEVKAEEDCAVVLPGLFPTCS